MYAAHPNLNSWTLREAKRFSMSFWNANFAACGIPPRTQFKSPNATCKPSKSVREKTRLLLLGIFVRMQLPLQLLEYLHESKREAQTCTNSLSVPNSVICLLPLFKRSTSSVVLGTSQPAQVRYAHRIRRITALLPAATEKNSREASDRGR